LACLHHVGFPIWAYKDIFYYPPPFNILNLEIYGFFVQASTMRGRIRMFFSNLHHAFSPSLGIYKKKRRTSTMLHGGGPLKKWIYAHITFIDESGHGGENKLITVYAQMS